MQQISDTWEKDRDGTIHIGRHTRGCHHCGRVETKYSQNGRVALHHPGSTCCRKAIEQQLAWRQAELAHLRQEAADYQAEMDAANARAANSVGRDAADAHALAERMKVAYQHKLTRWRIRTDGGVDPLDRDQDAPPHVGIKQEIRELEQALAALRVPA